MHPNKFSLLLALATAPLFATDAKPAPAATKIGNIPAAQKTTPESEEQETGISGSPREVRADLLNSPNDELAWITRRVMNGTADRIMQRAYWRANRTLGQRGAPPENWAAEAAAARARLSTTGKQRFPGAGTFSPGIAFPGITPELPAATYTWTNLGPFKYTSGSTTNQGRATAIWINPGNAANWLAGFADGGLWKTTDSGTTWTPLLDRQVLMSVGSIAVDPGNTSIIYVGMGEGNFSGSDILGTNAGVLKSTDGGVNWTRYTIPWPTVNNGTSFNGPLTPGARGIRRIVIDPKNTSRLYAAAGGGVMLSTDAGLTWTMLNSGGIAYTGNPANCSVGAVMYPTDIVIDSTTSPNSTVYAAFGRPFSTGACTPGNQGRAPNGVYRSTDNGVNWTKIASMGAAPFPTLADCAGFGRLALAISPSSPSTMYLMVHKPGFESTCTATADSYDGTYKTTNATAAVPTWTKQSTTNFCSGQCWYDMHGTVDPTNPAVAYFGGLDLYQTTNSATTLTKRSAWNGVPYVHADQHHLVMINSTTLIEATDGGVFQVTVNPAGGAITPVDKNGGGLSTAQFYGIGQHPTTANEIHGGLQDNGEAATTNGTTWTEAAGGDGGISATDQSNGNNAYEEYVYGSIARSTSGATGGYSCIQNFGGATGCTGNTVPDGTTEFIAPFVLDPNNQSAMFTGSKYLYLNTTANSGSTWTKITRNGVATAGFVDPANASTTQDINYIHVSKAGGKVCNGNTTSFTIYVGGNTGSIWKTTTGNQPFTEVDKIASVGTPKRAVDAIVTDPTNGARVLVGYDGWTSDANAALPSPTAPGHLYRSTDGGTTWTSIDGALPDNPILSLAMDPADATNSTVYIGTYAGVYQMTSVWTTPVLTNVSANMPNVAVMALEFTNATTPKRLRAATHGRGIWELTVSAGATAKPVSDGAGTTPLKASKGAGNNINVTFDTATCTTNGGFNAYWGNLTAGALSAYTYSGQECSIVTTGPITSVPAASSAFFVVVGTDGATQESRNTMNSAGAWNGSGVGFCGITTQNTATTCP